MSGSRRWPAAAGILLCALLGCSTRPPMAEMVPLRVMTFNIAAGAGDLARTAATIRDARADIVALQEVDVTWSARSSFADQAAELASLLGMHVRFAPIYALAPDSTSPAGSPRRFGVALLSRYPITAFHNRAIPRLSTQSGDTVPRSMPGFLHAEVDIDGVPVHVFNTHLDYRADPRVRVQQVTAMLDIMGIGDVPMLLLGDLNARPDAAELAPLFGRLRDAWVTTGAGYTYPASAPDRRIDYVLISDHFTVRAARVITGDASDHLPVVADLWLMPSVRRLR